MRHQSIREPAPSELAATFRDGQEGRDRRVDQVMSRDVRACKDSDSLNSAACSLWDHDCGALPVLDSANRVVGMITDRDICMSALWEGKDLHHIPVSRARSERLYACNPADSVSGAQSVMRQHQVRRLPVVDGDGRLVGIISQNDIVRSAVTAAAAGSREDVVIEAATTLSTIGAPRPEAVSLVN